MIQYENTYENRCAQYESENAGITTVKTPVKKGKSKRKTKASKKLDETNPYVRARIQILEKYPEWRKNEVLKMEESGETDNRFYNDFVKEVTDLGDTFLPLN